MEIILIISTLVAFLFTAVIWKIWKWFEFEAWIAPATMADFCKAMLSLVPAIIQAEQALAEFGMVMAQAQLQMERVRIKHKFEPGGIVTDRRRLIEGGDEYIASTKELPILATRREIILRGRATGRDWLFDGGGQVGRISDNVPLPE